MMKNGTYENSQRVECCISGSCDAFDDLEYLKSWISALQNDYNEFFRACADAEKISAYLMTNYSAGERGK